MRPLRILLLGADPAARRDLEREARELARVLPRMRVRLVHQRARTPAAVREALDRHRPDLVHITGRDRGSGGERPILLEDDGQAVPVEARWLAELVTSVGTVRCLVLEACGTPSQVAALRDAVGCVITVTGERATSSLAILYERLGRGDSVGKAFEIARAPRDIGGPRPVSAPFASLTTRPGVSADRVTLVDLAEPIRKAWWILVAVVVVVLGIVGYGGYRLVRAVWGERDAATPDDAARVGD